MKHFEVFNARYNEENKEEASKIADLICSKFGVFTENCKCRVSSVYHEKSNRFSLYFFGTDEEHKELCRSYYETI